MAYNGLNSITNLYNSALNWLGDQRVVKKITIALIIIAVALGIITYSSMTNVPVLSMGRNNLIILINLNLAVLLLLFVIIAKRLVELWVERRKGLAGSNLHARLVLMLGLLTIIPTIFIGIFSAFFINRAVESWFSKDIEEVLEKSTDITRAYLDEHKKVLRNDAMSLREDVLTNLPSLLQSKELFDQFMQTQAGLRNLDEAIVFSESSGVLGRSLLAFALEFEKVDVRALENSENDILIISDVEKNNSDRVRALVRIRSDLDLYMIVGRIVDPAMLKKIEDTKIALKDYHKIKANLHNMKLKFAVIFVMVAFLLLLISVWFGLSYANQLAKPISRLIDATQKVSRGKLDVNVVIPSNSEHDISLLAAAFNKMTKRLQEQQRELILANDRLEKRRQFIEAMLYSVPANVVGLTKDFRIHLANAMACDFFGEDIKELRMKKISAIFPEIVPLLGVVGMKGEIEKEIVTNRNGLIRTMHVKIIEEKPLHRGVENETDGDISDGENLGYVLVFNDITDLIHAQKQSAWSDVARKVAHEIKNPLTPIQLSAERLKSRYAKDINDKDREKFEKCVDTISRQVDKIGGLVKEFSDFARMPQPIMEQINIGEILEQVCFMHQQAHPDISIVLQKPSSKVIMLCDPGQMEQVIINLVQNSIDSVKEKMQQDKGVKGEVKVILEKVNDQVNIYVKDNGIGFPDRNREKLFDPYVTFKEKGTGLGLSIVKKIVEDHAGDMLLQDNPGGGAQVVLRFKLK